MKKARLLILEDVMTDAELIVRTLKHSGLDFDHAIVSDKPGFEKVVNEQVFDIILADNALPQFSARETLDIINARSISTPFILVTGSISEEYAVEIMKEGACDYILKDRLQRLPNAVNSAIEKSRLQAERKKYFDEVVANEALLKEAARLAQFGSWEIDLLNNTERWSDEQYRILGYVPGEIEPSLPVFLNHVHPDDLWVVKQIMGNTLQSHSRQKYYFRIICKSGFLKHIHAEVAVTRNDKGAILRMNGVIRDVSETRKANEMLQKSEANLRAIFNNTETGYVLLDHSLTIVSLNKLANKFFIDLLQQSLEEGVPVLDYFNAGMKALLRRYFSRVLKGADINHEINHREPTGFDRWYHICYHPVWNAEKNILGIVVAITDITARKISELQERKVTDELMRRNNDLEQFAYIISHDLRAPVANIIGISNVMGDGTLDDNDKSVLMDGLTKSVKKLDAIIIDLNDILQVNHIIRDDREVVFFLQIVNDIKQNIGRVFDEKEITIACDFTEVAEVHTLKSYIHSVFYNLISNSIKYRQPGRPPHIQISSHKHADKIELKFKDNCIGIDLENNRGHIFGLYKRFHPEYADGKGMGLYMVKSQVEALGGRISVQSKVNEGTEFIIEFSRNMLVK